MPIDPLLVSPPRPHRPPDIEVVDDPGEVTEASERRDVDTVVREDVESAYQRLYPPLVRLAFLLVDTIEHAEEAVQDAFAKAYPKWDRIDDADAYMRIAVVNTCRKVQRRRTLMRRTPTPRTDDAALGADHVADVVRRLPLSLRQVVVLRYYLQLSDTEIAQTLGMPIGTVKSTLHRARAQMREELS